MTQGSSSRGRGGGGHAPHALPRGSPLAGSAAAERLGFLAQHASLCSFVIETHLPCGCPPPRRRGPSGALHRPFWNPPPRSGLASCSVQATVTASLTTRRTAWSGRGLFSSGLRASADASQQCFSFSRGHITLLAHAQCVVHQWPSPKQCKGTVLLSPGVSLLYIEWDYLDLC